MKRSERNTNKKKSIAKIPGLSARDPPRSSITRALTAQHFSTMNFRNARFIFAASFPIPFLEILWRGAAFKNETASIHSAESSIVEASVFIKLRRIEGVPIMAKKTTKKTSGTETPVSNSGSISTTSDVKMEAAATNSPATTNPPATTSIPPKATKRPELVAAQTRSNLVPISLDDEIRALAYLLSERRGFQPGHETEDWLSAEREVRQRYHRNSA